jgi:hypothetical protein
MSSWAFYKLREALETATTGAAGLAASTGRQSTNDYTLRRAAFRSAMKLPRTSVLALFLVSPACASTRKLSLEAFENPNATWRIPSAAVDTNPRFPPQFSIVRACAAGCASVPSFWMAVPTANTMSTFGYPGGNVQEGILAYGLWDAAETRLAATVFSHACTGSRHSNGHLVVDIGSNTGFFSAMALAAGCRVIAFDGSPVHAPYLALSAQLSGVPHRFTFHNNLVSDTAAVVPYNHWSIALSANIGQPRTWASSVRPDDLIDEDILYLKSQLHDPNPPSSTFTKLLCAPQLSPQSVLCPTHTPLPSPHDMHSLAACTRGLLVQPPSLVYLPLSHPCPSLWQLILKAMNLRRSEGCRGSCLTMSCRSYSGSTHRPCTAARRIGQTHPQLSSRHLATGSRSST